MKKWLLTCQCGLKAALTGDPWGEGGGRAAVKPPPCLRRKP